MVVNAFLLASARKYPQKMALVVGPRRYTHHETYQKVYNLASHLVAGGFKNSTQIHRVHERIAYIRFRKNKKRD